MNDIAQIISFRNEITYENRQSVITKLRSYQLKETALLYQDAGADAVTIPYLLIGKVEAEFAPSRVQPNRYFLHIYSESNGKIDITNTHYVGIGDLEDRSDQYVPFVKALHKKILEHNPGAVFQKASSWGGYIFAILMVVFLIAVVVVAGIFFALFGLFWVTLIKLALIIYYFPSLIRYVKRNKPGEYDPVNLSADIIPTITNEVYDETI